MRGRTQHHRDDSGRGSRAGSGDQGGRGAPRCPSLPAPRGGAGGRAGCCPHSADLRHVGHTPRDPPQQRPAPGRGAHRAPPLAEPASGRAGAGAPSRPFPSPRPRRAGPTPTRSPAGPGAQGAGAGASGGSGGQGRGGGRRSAVGRPSSGRDKGAAAQGTARVPSLTAQSGPARLNRPPPLPGLGTLLPESPSLPAPPSRPGPTYLWAESAPRTPVLAQTRSVTNRRHRGQRHRLSPAPRPTGHPGPPPPLESAPRHGRHGSPLAAAAAAAAVSRVLEPAARSR